jgi:hypothetical protein
MLFMRQARQITSNTDNGRELYFIPLGRYGHKGTATVYREDFELLVSLGVSESWDLQAGRVTVGTWQRPFFP